MELTNASYIQMLEPTIVLVPPLVRPLFHHRRTAAGSV